jgi:hypothetical protein
VRIPYRVLGPCPERLVSELPDDVVEASIPIPEPLLLDPVSLEDD